MSRKILNYIFPLLTDFWKIPLFILFRWLSQASLLNLVTLKYVLLSSTICAFLCSVGPSYYLLVMQVSGCLPYLIGCFFCLLLQVAWSNEGNIGLSSSVTYGLSGILRWKEFQINSSVEFCKPVDGSAWFSCFYRFLELLKIFCVAVNFTSIYLLNR